MLTGALSAVKNFVMYLRKPIEWVPSFLARIFISPTSVTPIVKSFHDSYFSGKPLMTDPQERESPRPVSPIISEVFVLRCSVTDSKGGITGETSHPPNRASTKKF